MTIDFKNEPDADFSDLLRAIDSDIPGLVLEVGRITRSRSLCYSATFGRGSSRTGWLTGVGDSDDLPGAFFYKLDGKTQGFATAIGSIYQVERIHEGHHGYEIRLASQLWKGQ